MIRNYKRKPYRIVNKSHQYRFLAITLIYNLIIVGFLAVVLFIPAIIRMYDQTLSPEIRTIAANNILMLNSRVWPAVILLVCGIGLHSIRMFNRFVGPLYRFTLTFKDVSSGNLDCRIKLRKKDFLLEEAEVINDMFDVINQKISNIQTKGKDALELLGKLEQGNRESGDQIEPWRENIAALSQKLDELTASANFFKTR